MNELGIFEKKGKAVVSSRDVAKCFEKEHRNVLRDIDNIIKQTANIDEGMPKFEQTPFGLLNFEETHYTEEQNGQKYRAYNLTRDGFTMLIMGYTGEKATAFKVAYINEFNAMESLIREKLTAEWREARINGKKVRRKEMDVIRDVLIPHAVEQGSTHAEKLYMNYSKLINSILEIEAGKRNELPQSELLNITFLEQAIEKLVYDEVLKGTPYKEIYQICKAKLGVIRDIGVFKHETPSQITLKEVKMA